MDFRILEWISGFLDFKVDFWISDWISADSVRDFFRGGPLAAEQRSKRFSKRRERDRARRAAQLQVKVKLLHSRKVPVNAKE